MPVAAPHRRRGLLSEREDQDAPAVPLYTRLLRLKHLQPAAWQRALLLEGTTFVGAVVALADKATAWSPLILPVAAAAAVKFNDVVVGLLPRRAELTPADSADPDGADPDGAHADGAHAVGADVDGAHGDGAAPRRDQADRDGGHPLIR